MILAHLIWAHAKPNKFERLLKRLSHTDADIYIHIDKKANLPLFSKVEEIPTICLIKKRVKLNWETCRIVKATITVLESINNVGKG